MNGTSLAVQDKTGWAVESTLWKSGYVSYCLAQREWITDGIWRYTVEKDDTVTLRQVSSTVPKRFTVPETIDGHPVTTIGVSCMEPLQDTVFSIVLSANLLTIEDEAFRGCAKLQRVTFDKHSSLKTIGSDAFYGCSALEWLKLPDSVEKLGSAAFSYTGLIRMTLPAGITEIPNECFYGCKKLSSAAMLGKVRRIGDYAFGHCRKLDSVSLSDALEEIGEFAFAGDAGHLARAKEKNQRGYCLKSISIPAGVTKIGKGAFANNDSLATVTFAAHSKLTAIPEMAFDSCSALKEISLPSGTETIGPDAFFGCTRLKKVHFGNSLKKLGSNCFYGCTLTAVYVPETCREFGENPFGDNTQKLVITAVKDSPVVQYARLNLEGVRFKDPGTGKFYQ